MPRTSARRDLIWRALLSLIVLAASAYLLLTTVPRLGLDLRGGTQIVLDAHDSPTAKADAAATDRTIEVLRRRIDALGVSEPTLARSGEKRIVVELPGVQDPAEAVRVIGRTAKLSFHSVAGVAGQTRDESGQPLQLGPAALSGDGVESAQAGSDPQVGPGWFVNVEFKAHAGQSWEKLTAQAACAESGDPRRRVAIVLDGKVISSPQVDEKVGCGTGMIGGKTTITGRFTAEEAQNLALLINAGALPLPVQIVEQRTIGPTLGAEAIDASAQAAVIGLALTAIFLIVVYWAAGAIAVVSLLGYAAVSYAALLAIGATLTLPGLAGFVLAIGMAVDATVLVFERAREERLLRGVALHAAIDRGFRGAMSAIIDSNVTTLLAAGLLFWLASGPVRGFGVTLTIGVLASLFTSLVLTRLLLRIALRGPEKLSGLSHEGGVRRWVNRRNPNFLAHPRKWLIGAGVALCLALTGLVVQGPNFGVEFTGGRVLEYQTATKTEVERVRTAVSSAGFPRAVVQTSGDDKISVRTEPVDQQQATRIRAAIEKVAGKATQVRDDKIGPSLGEELRTSAVIALCLAVAAQLVYLAVRFDWRLGLASVIAMTQDALLVIGVFAWLGKSFDGVFLAALLTVIGYSVNDTVVVFDRVREIRQRKRRQPFAETVGSAVLQTLPRTVNTGIGVIFVLGALLVLGDGSLSDFALALLLGLIVGTASTVVTAGPIAIVLDRHRKPSAVRTKPQPRRRGAVV
ncbi:protein translocase subunit SecD [Fodinicola acaciae]|uniref:protein translocase subunit SecD n=1 Tax=Fodinicola acaciae TaxID=2681555 RepID=UPI0013D8D8A1|nr:protein translocase subunit SecD [Fodinicola acaciae]